MVFRPVLFCRKRLLGVNFTLLASSFVLVGNVLVGNGVALAQLRTGSTTRDLYQSRAADERAVLRSSSNAKVFSDDSGDNAGSPVIQASHVAQRDQQGRPEPRRVPAGARPPAKLASCSTCNSNSVSMTRAERSGQDQSILEMRDSEAEQILSEPWEHSSADGSFDHGTMHLHERASSSSPVSRNQIYGDMSYGDTCCSQGCNQRPMAFSPLQALWCRTSVRAETPLFWRRGHSTPPLITTSPLGTPADTAGQLGRNTTDILQEGVFGQDARAGLRLTFSTYLDDCRTQSLVVRYWNAGTRNDRNIFDSNDFPILARPFRNTSNPASPTNDTQLIAFPGDTFGRAEVYGSSELYGLDIGMKRLVYSDRFSRVHWIYGYQQVSLGERLRISSDTTVIGNLPPLQGASIAVSDHFRTHNRFNGSNLGVQTTRRFGCFHLETMLQLGLGNLRREVQVSGSTTTTSAGTSSSTNEGLLARQSNSRRIIDDTFVIAPEVGVNLAYALTSGIDFTIGYNYLMVPKVYQAGSLIDPDLRVNLSDPLVGQLDPQLNLSQGRYWVRTLGLGLQIRY